MNYNIAFDNKKGEFDKVYKSMGVEIYCDLQSWLYLKGTTIDFSDDILSGGFRIENPNASRTCGCGTSFSV
jgi:iron-sulfur cluster assembly protein